jgi:hypothetical protein
VPGAPTTGPTRSPTLSFAPTIVPSNTPTSSPTRGPTRSPTLAPSRPTAMPTTTVLDCTSFCSLHTPDATPILAWAPLRSVQVPDFMTLRFEVRNVFVGMTTAAGTWYNIFAITSESDDVLLALNVMTDGALQVVYGGSAFIVPEGMLPVDASGAAAWTSLSLRIAAAETNSAFQLTSSYGGTIAVGATYPFVRLNSGTRTFCAAYNVYPAGGDIRNIQIQGRFPLLYALRPRVTGNFRAYLRDLFAAYPAPTWDCQVFCAPLNPGNVAAVAGNLLGSLQLPQYFTLSFEVLGVGLGLSGTTPNILSLVNPSNLIVVLAVDTTSSRDLRFRYNTNTLAGPQLPALFATNWSSVVITVTAEGVTISTQDGGSVSSYAALTVGTISTPRTLKLYSSSSPTAGGYLRNLQVSGKTHLLGRIVIAVVLTAVSKRYLSQLSTAQAPRDPLRYLLRARPQPNPPPRPL